MNLKELFHNASKDFLALHGIGDPPSRPIVERLARTRPLATQEAQVPNTGRVLVRVVSYRRRLLDEDNLAEKYFVDCARYAGLISNDDPSQTHIEVSQEKVARKEDERTEITITHPCTPS